MLIKYLKIIRDKSHKYDRTDINGHEVKSSKIFLRQVLFVLITIVLFLFSLDGFSERLLEYCVSALSILTGLFITVLVFVSEKIPNKESNNENISAKERTKKIQLYNYYKQFSFIIGRTTVLSVFCLIIIFFLIQIGTSYNPFEYIIAHQIDIESVFLFFKITINLVLRFLFIYWMIRIFYNTLFAVSSLTNIINLKKE